MTAKTTLRASVLSGMRWTAGSKALGQLFAWLGTFLVVRLLSPQDYGVIAVGGFFIVYLLLLSEGGLSDALVRTTAPTRRLLEEVQGVLYLINGGSCIALAAASPLIASYFHEPRLREVLPALSVQFLIVSVGIIPTARLKSEFRFKELSSIDLVQTVLVTLVTIVCALLGLGVWSLVISNLFGLLLRAVLLIRATGEFHRPRFHFQEARALSRFSGYVLLEQTAWHIFANADAMIVSKLLGIQATGLYAVANNLASLPANKLSGTFAKLALPAFVQIMDDRQRMFQAYLKGLRLIAVVAFPIGFGLAAVATPAIAVALGPRWSAATPVFAILTLAVPFRLITMLDPGLLLALGLPKAMLQNRLAGLLLLLVFLIVGALQMGLTGIALAWVVAAPTVWIATAAWNCRRLGWRLSSLLNVATRPLAASILMYLSVLLAERELAAHDAPSAVRLVLEMALGAGIYTIVTLLIDRPTFMEAWLLTRDLLRRSAPKTATESTAS